MTKTREITKALLKWFENNRREFYWRRKNITLYQLLVSEIFLWKTQASTASSFLKAFFKKYPSPKSIKNTPIKVLAKDIKRLGLSNRRARLLKQAFSSYDAKHVPTTEKEFRKRFQVGQYIGRSILAIHYGQGTFPIDQNMSRFFGRVFNREITNVRTVTPKDESFLCKFIRKGSPEIIWATIDFASLLCTSKNPRCKQCFLNDRCFYFKKIGKVVSHKGFAG